MYIHGVNENNNKTSPGAVVHEEPDLYTLQERLPLDHELRNGRSQNLLSTSHVPPERHASADLYKQMPELISQDKQLLLFLQNGI